MVETFAASFQNFLPKKLISFKNVPFDINFLSSHSLKNAEVTVYKQIHLHVLQKRYVDMLI